MNYNTNQSIFIQIAERICDRVLSGNYKADSRIPSVRELAVEMEVNPNTVMRSFERLQANEIIYNKRGIGYFVASDAEQKIREMRHNQFVEEVLPAVFKEMHLLDVGIDELTKAYTLYIVPALTFGVAQFTSEKCLTGFTQKFQIIQIDNPELKAENIKVDTRTASEFPRAQILEAKDRSLLYYEGKKRYLPEVSRHDSLLLVSGARDAGQDKNLTLHIRINNIQKIRLNGEEIWTK